MQSTEISARLLVDPPGWIEAPAFPDPLLVVHVGPSVHVGCNRAGASHAGINVHGDIDIIPAGVPSLWRLREKDTALVIRVPSTLLQQVAQDSEIPAPRVELINRFQIRDRQIEHLAWALKAEMDAGDPGGAIYKQSLGVALAVSLLKRHASVVLPGSRHAYGLSGHRFRTVLSYIEDNLAGDLSLNTIANISGLGVSQLKRAFLASAGVPVHQYVIQRRVERAKVLLGQGTPISQTALDAGFAHQSHLARHMRRLLGISPSSLRSASE
jgi:AraC family transcriptional regulator